MSEAWPIVVVDDDHEFVAFVERIVRDAGWNVRTFTDARAAQAALLDGLEPALLLVDLMMPYIDGEEFALWHKREIAPNRIGRETPIIFLSAAWMIRDAAERAQVQATLAKPFTVDELRDVCVRFAQVHRTRGETDPPAMP